MPGQVRTLLYRIVQEGLVNAVKHGRLAPIDVTVHTRDTVYVSIRNGRPSGPGVTVPGAQRGLAGLAERVHAVRGRLDAGPTPDQGWLLRVELD